MKKSFVLVLLLVSAFTVLFSSELKDSGNWMKATQLAVLEIDENPTTGYLWHISVEPSGVLRNFLEEYMTGSAFPGAPSVKGWIMTAAKEGKALLTLKLYRDWEGERKAIDFRAVTVDVSERGEGPGGSEDSVERAGARIDGDRDSGRKWQHRLHLGISHSWRGPSGNQERDHRGYQRSGRGSRESHMDLPGRR